MRTILIIDDDDVCRGTAAKILRRRAWQVLEADNGQDGLRLAFEHRPEVILADLLMPKVNGYAVCRAVREHMDLRHTHVMVMSGRDYPTDRESALEAGAERFLLKPLVMEDLTELLETIPPNGHLPHGEPVESGGDHETTIRFWGVRGSVPTPGRGTVHYGGNTSCVEVRADGEHFVLDAGTGIRGLGQALALEREGEPIALTILITHTHWDHIQGFPFFMPAYDPKNQFRILGYEGARASLAATLAGQMESPYFPIPLKHMPGNLTIEELREMEFRVGEVRVTSCFSKHPGVCVGYRLHTSAGSVVFLPDNEWSDVETKAAEEGGPCSQENALVKFVRGAEVLIMDAQYDREEYESHRGWGHGCLDDVVRLAMFTEVRQLFLFHHDPDHDDAFITKMVETARQLAKEAGSPLKIDAAREGVTVRLHRTAAV